MSVLGPDLLTCAGLLQGPLENLRVRHGLVLPHDQVAMVSAYLAQHFPPRNAPKPVLIAVPGGLMQLWRRRSG